jgi:hypothetical protein
MPIINLNPLEELQIRLQQEGLTARTLYVKRSNEMHLPWMLRVDFGSHLNIANEQPYVAVYVEARADAPTHWTVALVTPYENEVLGRFHDVTPVYMVDMVTNIMETTRGTLASLRQTAGK